MTPETYANADAMYKDVIATALNGAKTAPRGMKTREVLHSSFTLDDANKNIVTNRRRAINPIFSVAEWMWIMLGRRDVATIAYFNQNIARFSDDGKTFYGAYGPWVTSQLPHVVRSLTADPDSRQAVLTIWQQSPPRTKDVPCTVAIQFLLRRGRLHAQAFMRSNDVWLGFPYDLFNFTRIQAYVAALVGVPVGRYTHTVGSLHLYEENMLDAAEAYNGEVVQGVESPALTPLPIGTGLPDVPRMFEALADASTAASVPTDYASAPWSTYLGLLKYKTTRDRSTLLAPYDVIVRPRPTAMNPAFGAPYGTAAA